MPNVGLNTGSDPLKTENQVIIRFSVEVRSLLVYKEIYDLDTVRNGHGG
jgi:hypothetical protein